MEPDDYSFMVEYEPTGKCIEIMSFKEYLDGFKEIQAFAEDIYNKIFYDIVTLVEPKSLTINLEDKSDGMQIGIWGRL
jgi:7-cyano-7-deazaguanine reductase